MPYLCLKKPVQISFRRIVSYVPISGKYQGTVTMGVEQRVKLAKSKRASSFFMKERDKGYVATRFKENADVKELIRNISKAV